LEVYSLEDRHRAAPRAETVAAMIEAVRASYDLVDDDIDSSTSAAA
jgi:hypothetical protein